jgi:16S rRNA (cytosine1402-N4)-methyltransferase
MRDRDLGEPEAWHVPVMAEEVNEFLISERTEVIVDCTVGTGGHAEAMLRAAPANAILVGFDLDREALDRAAGRLRPFGDRVILRKMNFKNLASGLPARFMGRVNALLVDCGISMLQIVKTHRGFSFDRSGPIDMRFDRAAPESALTFLQGTDMATLSELLSRFGEKAGARRIARAILRARDKGELATTGDLAAAVKSAVRGRPVKTLARVFLAIRAGINREIENLSEALEAFPSVLASGGRAAVIAYHGNEDRVVKQYFRKFSGRCVCPPGRPACECGKANWFRVLTPKPVRPSAEEIRLNPASRSAKLTVVEKM